MIYFTLPNTNNSIYKYIDCIYDDEVENHDKKNKLFDISNSLSFYLYEMKNKIKKYEREWDIYKKYTNPYEFINTIIPGKNKCIAKYKPLSRSYFKMIELLHFFFLDEFVDAIPWKKPQLSESGPNLTPKVASILLRSEEEFEVQGSTGQVFGSEEDRNKESKNSSRKSIRSFHLAEGPGGFIEALANTRNNPHDVYVGITILESRRVPNIVCDMNGPNVASLLLPRNSEEEFGPNLTPKVAKLPLEFEKEKSSVPDTCNKNNVGKHNKSVPGWKKSDYFLKSHPNIHIETGADKTGNILSMDNFLHCRAKYGSSMDLITGDGGFDFSADFNNQEMNITQLLFAQMCYALCLQKYNGSFILKIFDCFMEHTVDILYILSAFYETVYITKPKTSRYANSEKYLVCKNFLFFDDSSVFPCLKMAFQKMLGKESEHKNIYRFLKIPIPAYYIYKLEEYNTIYGQQQIENIYQTIILIEQIRPEQEDKEPRCGNNSTRVETPNGSLTGLRSSLFVDFPHTSSSEATIAQRGVRLGSQSSKINNLVRTHLRKCVHWCLNHNIPHNIMDD